MSPSLIVASLLCLLSMLRPPLVASTPETQDSKLEGGLIAYVPPRAFLFCWQGTCDPRLWAEMAKRTPYYNFGLGKRSATNYRIFYEPDDDGDEDDQGDDSGALAMEKRAKYSFGVGKRPQDDSHRFNFGLGKRESGQRFQFGLGKREAGPFNFGLGKREAGPFNFGLGKREARPFNFGLGKREGQRFAFGLGKRPEQQPFSFGLGKREGQRFAFGLGKREVDPNLEEEDRLDEESPESFEDDGQGNSGYRFGPLKREVHDTNMDDDVFEDTLGKRMSYDFGLGKRQSPYNFGLGKRDKNYGFGLGKRDSFDPESRYAFGLGKRVSPYSFGLGKRSGAYLQRLRASSTGNDENGKRSKFAFGLGKRSEGANGNEGTKTTVAPNENGHHQQPKQLN